MKNRKKRRFIYNWDGSDCLAMIPEHPTPDDLIQQVYAPFEGSEVDTLFYMQGVGNVAEFKSEVLEMVGARSDYHFASKSISQRYQNAMHFLDQGIDPLDIVIQGARERKLDIFYSLRLNDIHDHWVEGADFTPTFKDKHPEWLQPKEWFPDFHGNNAITTAINYSVKAVRDFRIALIRELMGNHDFDGLELDFMRSQFYFHWDKGLSSAHIMTDFIAEIRGVLDEIGSRRGKYLELAAKVCTTVVGSRMAGFDVETWAKRGLVDIIIAGTGGINFDMQGFKAILAETGVSFFPCLYGDYERIASSDEVMRGIAEVLLMDEPDGIYSFNFYPTQTHRKQLLTHIGSLEALKGLDKTYIVDMDYDYILTREEWRYNLHLPAVLAETKREGLVVPIKAGEDLTVYPKVSIHLRIWIQDVSIKDRTIYKFNAQELGTPMWEKVGDQFWHVWKLAASDVKPVNHVYIQLLERNQHLRRFAPAIVQRINIEVKFPVD